MQLGQTDKFGFLNRRVTTFKPNACLHQDNVLDCTSRKVKILEEIFLIMIVRIIAIFALEAVL